MTLTVLVNAVARSPRTVPNSARLLSKVVSVLEPSPARSTTALSKMMTTWHDGMTYCQPFLQLMMSQSTEVKVDARFMELMSSAMVSLAPLTAIVTAGAADTSFHSPYVDACP